MNAEELHKHPRGIRFFPKEAGNRWAVSLTLSLIDKGCRLNGWHSWRDMNPYSEDFGRWVAINAATGQTYVEKNT